MNTWRANPNKLGKYERLSRQHNHHFDLNKLSLKIAAVFGLGLISSQTAFAQWFTCDDPSGTDTVRCSGTGTVVNKDFAGYDHVIVNITGGYNVSGPKGMGYYVNGSSPTINAQTVLITTDGSQADAIRTNGQPTLTINGQLTVKAMGISGDAINAANSNNSAALIEITGDGAYIESRGGMAVRANLTPAARGNEISIANYATMVTKGNGSNLSSGSGYAVYAGDRGRDTVGFPAVGTARVFIGDNSSINTSGNDAYAVYANKTGQVQLGSTTITTTGSRAHGIVAQDGTVDYGYYGGFLNAIWYSYGEVRHFDGGQVYLTGDTAITVDSTKGSYAVYSSGKDSLVTSGKVGGTLASGVFNVKGDLVANNSGAIDLTTKSGSSFVSNVRSDNATINLNGIASYTGNFAATNNGTIALNGTPSVVGDFVADTGGAINLVGANNSYIKGKADTSTGTGIVNLSLSGASSTWDVTGVSTLTNLELNGGSQVIFGDWTAAPENANRIIFTMDTLSGNGGKFYIGTNLDRDTKAATIDVNDADMIRITGASSGTHTIFVYDDRTGGYTPGDMPVRVVEADNKGATFRLGTTGFINVGALEYVLVEEGTLTGGVQGAGHWALAPTSRLNNFAQNSVGLLNTNYLLSHIETQTLLQRMGELRTPSNKGDVWGRVYTGQLSSFDDGRISGHDLNYHGMQFGVDRQLDSSADGQVYVGAMLGYTTGKTDYNVGSGKTDGYHIGVYGTYMMNNGFYVDGLLKYQHLKNKVSSVTGGGYSVDGSDSSSGMSIGIEAGKRFYLQQPDQGWYLEPQGQLTYTRQGSSTIVGSNGLRTDLSSYNSVIGRVSIIAGYEVVSGANPVNVYIKTGYVREFDGDTSYTFNNALRENYDFGGGWWDNGIGVNARINGKHNLYADLAYAKGGSFDKKQFNFGYRYEF